MSSSSAASSSPRATASPCTAKSRPEPWRLGVPGVPEPLQKRTFPCDRIGGVPLVRTLMPDLHTKLANAIRARRQSGDNLLIRRGLWGVSADPNFSDFHTLYVANSGGVVHFGEVLRVSSALCSPQIYQHYMHVCCCTHVHVLRVGHAIHVLHTHTPYMCITYGHRVGRTGGFQRSREWTNSRAYSPRSVHEVPS